MNLPTPRESRTNFSAVLHGTRDVRIEPRPVPVPAPHEVLVEIAAVGICGSDVHYYEHGRIGPYIVDSPMVIGHESAGTIVGVGGDVSPTRIGEVVALEPGVPCRRCPQCLSGRYNLCPGVVFFATPPVDGSISTYVVIDAAFAHAAPTGLGFEQAAMAEPVSVGVWAARKARVSVGDRVLVTGAGPIGLLAGQVAKAFGASVVLITDVSDFRLQTARALGLGASRADAPIDGKFDVLLECSGAEAALTAGMQALAPAARVVLVGMGADTVSINVPLIQGKEITLTGIFRYANTYPTALDLIARGAVNVDAVITHHFELAHTEEALTIGRRDPHALKAIVTPGR
ncbi:NAD(P)-dependent alcohol dehydrogenase [Cryobacterium melibiosiphilum]|uniref:NAD(P)-dependent alcohol dehydrogenase n=1 Tax=Cryobacterium melibiosiphilum TaxID=995039 RepID=A0A3A5MFF1_9MICO|nr:NAD(P)-dependent alcohol dehydrogenase [Cryobacterium melibiosiphilum]RJT88880.1 NAD(P)-dependent alcohol dehydrogenase [Cryobacterium melibiosiphilum]